MIHDIGLELGAELAEQKCPFEVFDGPERPAPTTFGRERIVLEFDDDAGDSFGPKIASKVNPKSHHVRTRGMKITIFAQSPKKGAKEFEHRVRADQVVDLVVVALYKVAGRRMNVFRTKGGRFVPIEDLAKSDRIGGAKYELKFTFDRGVVDKTFQGEARPEVSLEAGGLASTTKVSMAGADDDDDPTTAPADAETACSSE